MLGTRLVFSVAEKVTPLPAKRAPNCSGNSRAPARKIVLTHYRIGRRPIYDRRTYLPPFRWPGKLVVRVAEGNRNKSEIASQKFPTTPLPAKRAPNCSGNSRAPARKIVLTHYSIGRRPIYDRRTHLPPFRWPGQLVVRVAAGNRNKSEIASQNSQPPLSQRSVLPTVAAIPARQRER